MLKPGDIVQLELGVPSGSEAGMTRPAIVVTAARILRGGPNVVQVVPLTRTIRGSGAEVVIEPDDYNGLTAPSAAQCQHLRAVAVGRITAHAGNVGPVSLQQVRNTIGVILDL
ncbi:hypothetical protein GCM10027403_03610 [Arthrobacter tecti]